MIERPRKNHPREDGHPREHGHRSPASGAPCSAPCILCTAAAEPITVRRNALEPGATSPVVLQIGGSDPRELGAVAVLAIAAAATALATVVQALSAQTETV